MVFKGLKNHTAASIKSLEGFNRAFVEEAQTITKRSLDMLVPTIRAKGSQLLFGWNPDLPTDPIDKFFEENKDDPDFVCIHVTYADNPWFPDVLRRDMERDRARDPEKYHHVWGGGYRKNSEARVFKNWTVGEFDVPAGARPYYGGDWGFAIDPNVLVRGWIVGRTLYIDREAYSVGCPTDKIPFLFGGCQDEELKAINAQAYEALTQHEKDTWKGVEDARKWPITSDSARPETIDYMQRHGFPHVQAARKGPGSVEDGVEFLKSFDIIIHPRCVHTRDEFTHYSYKVDKLTGEVLPVLADTKNNVIDSCIAEGQPVACAHGDIPIERVRVGDFVLTRAGYKRVLFSGVTGFDRETLRIETTNGTLVCTQDHRVYTARGFVRADALRYGDEIVNIEQGSWRNALSGMAGFTGATLKASSYQIGCTFAGRARGVRICFTGTFGRRLTVLSQMVSRCIISTAIPATTTSPTWRAWPQENIRPSIRGMMTGGSGNESISTAFGRSRRLGIPVRKGWPSTKRSGLWPTRSLSLFRNRVHSAATSLARAQSETGTASAAITANRNGAAPTVATTLIGLAQYAAASLASIATRRPRLVRGRVLTVSAGKRAARVYDLTVEGQPEFAAGGVLVHNCRYMAEQVRVFDGGTVYTTPETDIVEPTRPLPQFWPRVWALDIDGAKASVLWAAHDRESDTLWVYGEHVVQRHELALVADAIRTRNRTFGKMPGLFDHLARGRDRIEGARIIDALLDLHLDVFTVHCPPEAAVPEVTRRLTTKRIKVLDTCPMWLAQYRAYRRNKDGNIVEESDGLMRAMDLLAMEGPGIAGFDDKQVQDAQDEWSAGTRSSVTGY